MIYTVTLNPSIDYFVELDQLAVGEVNRVKRDKKMPGGKGINVSRVLKRLQVKSQALGFVGGFTGDFIETSLKNEGLETNFIKISGETRINVKVKADRETELNGSGPDIDRNQLDELFEKLSSLKEGDWLVLSGSVPSTLPKDIYQRMIETATSQKAKTIVDTTGDFLAQTLEYCPFMVKPNQHELEAFFEESALTVVQIVQLAKRLLQKGPQNVIVSMGGEGALLVNETQSYLASVPKGRVRNSVGAGDSLVAGFLGHYSEHGEIVEAFRYGVASGSATAFSVDLCQKEQLESLLPEIEIKEI